MLTEIQVEELGTIRLVETFTPGSLMSIVIMRPCGHVWVQSGLVIHGFANPVNNNQVEVAVLTGSTHLVNERNIDIYCKLVLLAANLASEVYQEMIGEDFESMYPRTEIITLDNTNCPLVSHGEIPG